MTAASSGTRIERKTMISSRTSTPRTGSASGLTATLIDLSERVTNALPWFIGAVVLLCSTLTERLPADRFSEAEAERLVQGPAKRRDSNIRANRHGRMRPEDVDPYQEASAIQILDALEMPRDEVRAVVAAVDPLTVHRYIELHGERLVERLADRLQTLTRLERILNEAILDRRSTSPSSHRSFGEVSDGTQ